MRFSYWSSDVCSSDLSDTDTRADRHERKRRCLILRFGADNKIDACSRQGAQNSICEARPISGWEQDERTPDKIGKPQRRCMSKVVFDRKCDIERFFGNRHDLNVRCGIEIAAKSDVDPSGTKSFLLAILSHADADDLRKRDLGKIGSAQVCTTVP